MIRFNLGYWLAALHAIHEPCVQTIHPYTIHKRTYLHPGQSPPRSLLLRTCPQARIAHSISPLQATYLPQADLLRITAKEAGRLKMPSAWGLAQRHGDGNEQQYRTQPPRRQVPAVIISGRSGTNNYRLCYLSSASFAKTPSTFLCSIKVAHFRNRSKAN